MEIKNGVIHLHSEHSLKDGAQKIPEMVARCGELGAKGIVLTDHGVLTGFKEFVDAVESYNKKNNTSIKAIPGCEVYYEEDNDDVTHRKHLVLIPIDNDGFVALCEIVTKSNERLDAKGFPRVNTAILENAIGPGTKGHGHVIACSACMVGVIASILLENDFIDNQMSSLQKKISRLYSPEAESYKRNKAKLEAVRETIKQKKEEQSLAATIAKRPFKKKENAVLKLEGTPEYEAAKAALDAEKQETEDAKEAINILKEEIASLKSIEKRVKDSVKEEEADHEKWYALKERLDYLESQKLTESELVEKAKAEIRRFEKIFGKGNFYLEIQNHRIPQELKVYPMIANLAKEMNMPIVATNDAHVTNKSEKDFKTRQIIRSQRFNTWEEMQESDKELYIKSDEELSSILKEIISEDIVEKAMQGIGDIIDRCNLSFEKVNHYPKFKSEIPGESAEECLIRIARKGIKWRYPNGEWNEEYEKRLNYEMEIIKKLDVCDYLCIVEDFLRYGRLLGKIDINDERFKADPFNIKLLEELADNKVGLGIGPGRGSAVGSLVCYLTGITSIDPIKYNLLFERFLNADRVTMPDIDSDFKPDIRALVLEYVKHKYGVGAVCQIMTRQTQGAKAAVRNCARLLGSERYNDTHTYLDLGDKIAKEIPTKIGTTLDSCWNNLMETFKENPDAITILNNAKLIEGSLITTGLHAAAVVISDNGNVSEYVPLLYNTKKEQWACQVNKDEAEAAGLLKMDFLGLRNLGIITETLKYIKEIHGKSIDIETVPMEPVVFEKIFAAGNTNSVFQFESGGMKAMLKQFKPTSIEDIILLVAAYRPGPMQYLDDITAVKNGTKKPDYVIPEMEEVLGTTYGKPVYQEQIMQIFNKFAGFSLGESDIIRRYMSKKKVEKFAAYKDRFIKGLVDNGADKNKAEEFWNQLLDFSKYAFNKSHAAAYAFVAYYTAWLKYFYPVEYLTAVMNDTKFEKLGGLINDCKIFNIPVLPPRINESKDTFSVSADGSAILYGLGLVKNVSSSASAIVNEREEHGRFTSFADFMLRTRCHKDVCESLINAGAFDEFSKSRTALLYALPDYCDCIKSIGMKKAIIEDKSKSETSHNNAKKALENLYIQIKEIEYDSDAEEDFSFRLKQEKEMTGAYITGHPLDSYPAPAKINASEISSLTESSRYATVFGVIKNLRETNRKSDGAKMAFFELEDLTGTIKVNCFTKAYAANREFIAEDAVVMISGEVQVDTFESFKSDEDGEGESVTETILVLNANKFSAVESIKPRIILEVSSLVEWAEMQDSLIGYWDKSGNELLVKDNLSGLIRETNKKVSKEILSDGRFTTFTI